MKRHQRLQGQTINSSLERLPQRSLHASSFQTQGFGVQKQAATSAPASKAELWANYQATKQLFDKGVRVLPIQAKLTIGQPGDKYEQEADSMAAQVMQMPESGLVNSNIANSVQARSIQPIQRVCSECQEETKEESKPEEDGDQIQTKAEVERTTELTSLQRKMDSADDPQGGSSFESQLIASKGGGSPLSDDVRSFMQPRFGADFSGVRVHTGSDAVQMNQDVNAQAFAHESDIYFGAGKAPGKDALTAHELTHVVQQTGGSQTKQISKQTIVQLKCGVDNEEDKVQRSAEISSVSEVGVQRSWLDDAVDTVTQAGGDAVDWAKDKGAAAVDTVTQAGGDAVDWAKETGAKYSNALLEQKKARLIAQINQARQQLSGQKSFSISGNQIATLNNYLATLDEKSQGFINIPGISAETSLATGEKAVGASTIESLLTSLQLSISAPLTSSTSSNSYSSDSGSVQGSIQRYVPATAAMAAAIAEAEATLAAGAVPATVAAPETGGISLGVLLVVALVVGLVVGIVSAFTSTPAAPKTKEDECLELYAEYEKLKSCPSCKGTDTPAQRAEKIACITKLKIGRENYLKEKCDDVLKGSIEKDRRLGKGTSEKNHKGEVAKLIIMLEKCAKKPTI